MDREEFMNKVKTILAECEKEIKELKDRVKKCEENIAVVTKDQDDDEW
jgi:chromosome segregation ATPase